jgi:transaldolase
MKQPGPAIESRLGDLSEHGQSVWIDYLSRDLLKSGELARLIDRDAVVGVTSNPTIFQKAISGGSAYDAQLQQERDQERTPKEVFYRLAARDIAAACDLLRPVWQTTSGLDGYVSWEVDPNLAGDREASAEEAHRLHGWIDRPNLYVKIPATTAGVGAIEDMIAAGRNINVTLIFSLQRHRQVVEAYISGLERLVGNGGDPAAVHSVASFFVSRVDTEADRRLEAIGGQDGLRGKLGIANAKLAYQHYLAAFSGPRWERLAAKGATKQRCLWASTSTKNPAYPDVMYVEGLIGPETVNTMPEETIRAFQDHGRVAETLTQYVSEAQRLLEELERVGVDYDDVVLTLEQEGVAKFVDSFAELLQGVRDKREALLAAGG